MQTAQLIKMMCAIKISPRNTMQPVDWALPAAWSCSGALGRVGWPEHLWVNR